MVTVALVIRVAILVALRLVVLRECRNNIRRPYSIVSSRTQVFNNLMKHSPPM